jgi:hypothetical protein
MLKQTDEEFNIEYFGNIIISQLQGSYKTEDVSIMIYHIVMINSLHSCLLIV